MGIRQAISRAVMGYYQKYVDEHSKRILKDSPIQYDRTLMVADPRRSECKNSVVQVPEHDTKNLIDKFYKLFVRTFYYIFCSTCFCKIKDPQFSFLKTFLKKKKKK